jgi:hypothetical protein
MTSLSDYYLVKQANLGAAYGVIKRGLGSAGRLASAGNISGAGQFLKKTPTQAWKHLSTGQRIGVGAAGLGATAYGAKKVLD